MASSVESLRAKAVERYGRTHLAASQAMGAALKEAAPRNRGELSDSIAVDSPTFDGARFSAPIRATAPQAEWTNSGTPAHEIRPVRARALRFKVGGDVVFARVVHHPGYAGSHWWDRTVERWPELTAAALSGLD